MTSPDPDRLRYAQIAGSVARHALGWRLTADEEAVALAELAEAAAGRADLLAERAGTALGFGEGRPDAARYRQIAELCIAAGADPALIERWIKVGRERAAVAAAIPYTGLPPGGLLPVARGRRPVRARGGALVQAGAQVRAGGTARDLRPGPGLTPRGRATGRRGCAAAGRREHRADQAQDHNGRQRASGQAGRYAGLPATPLPHGATSAVGRNSDQASAPGPAQHTAGNVRLTMGIDQSEPVLART